MEILSGAASVQDLQKLFSEALSTETSEQTPEEFRDQVRLNIYQQAFAERFASRAPTAWKDLVFLKPIAVRWLTHRMREALGTADHRDAHEAASARRLLHWAINSWMAKYGVNAPWVYAMAFTTLRAMALTQFFSTDPPNTLLHNTFPTVMVKDGNVELGQSSFEPTPLSSVVVCADLGMQEWNTLSESESSFRSRMIDAFTKELDAQLARVDHPLLAKDLKVNRRWADITLDRYAGHRSVRATAQANDVSRAMVNKAVESVRQVLGFEELPEDWHVTTPRAWRLHAT